ncbi:hypothetical protein [Pseudobacteroides cellulosolvens]|uniref:Uncharacterized protein n=1 Tax=Pseudobacteroides cellulosolvens ATCC 35603 = DSM 2933 TaxID=398512 RepID=A0A0L6JKW0_9FIRM|nr:hypothetical protein [Pseudobacteroides cellulosolvens]KNY26348.1 hypothetical protein Bccel_1610 [Pseudobacteroides cellulosolvens ATCC 35603 = DSM 2933]
METNNAVTIYKKNNGNLGTKSTNSLASIIDLNEHTIRMNEINECIFYHKYQFLRLKEGIFRRMYENYAIYYQKIRELEDADYEILKKEKETAIANAIKRKRDRELRGYSYSTKKLNKVN